MQPLPPASDRAHRDNLTIRHSHPESNRKPLPFKSRRAVINKDLESGFVSALLSAGKDLGRVLQEIDEISTALKSGKPESEILRAAVHPAVWYAVKQTLVERELRHLALCDDLTWLYNRRGFFAAATQQLKLARRNLKPALLLFCDLDNLKTINDAYGHREGDLALVRAADALESVFRDSDVLARLGGDEFAVLAMDLPPRHQQTIYARLQKALNRAAKDGSRYELSLSVGAAWYDPRNPVSLGELMEQADHAMYERKRMNRIPFAPKDAADLRKPTVAPKFELHDIAK